MKSSRVRFEVGCLGLEVSKSSQDHPGGAPGAPKSAREHPKSAPRAPKSFQERPRASKSVPRASQERPRARQERPKSGKRRPGGLKVVVSGCQGLHVVVDRRPWRGWWRGGGEVNLSVIGHHAKLFWNLAPSELGAGGFTGSAAIPPTLV